MTCRRNAGTAYIEGGDSPLWTALNPPGVLAELPGWPPVIFLIAAIKIFVPQRSVEGV